MSGQLRGFVCPSSLRVSPTPPHTANQHHTTQPSVPLPGSIYHPWIVPILGSGLPLSDWFGRTPTALYWPAPCPTVFGLRCPGPLPRPSVVSAPLPLQWPRSLTLKEARTALGLTVGRTDLDLGTPIPTKPPLHCSSSVGPQSPAPAPGLACLHLHFGFWHRPLAGSLFFFWEPFLLLKPIP